MATMATTAASPRPPFPLFAGCPRRSTVSAATAQCRRIEACVSLQAKEAQVDDLLQVGTNDAAGAAVEVGSAAWPEGRATAGFFVEWPLPSTQLWSVEGVSSATPNTVGAMLYPGLPQSACSLRLLAYPLAGKTVTSQHAPAAMLTPPAFIAALIGRTGSWDVVPLASISGFVGSSGLLPVEAECVQYDAGPRIFVRFGWKADASVAAGSQTPWTQTCVDLTLQLRYQPRASAP